MLKGPFRLLDRIILRILGVDEKDEASYAQIRGEVENIDHILHDMSIIDSKSSALLTHVSIMLAVIIALMVISDGSTWRFVLAFELIAYSAIGTLLLRCVDVMGPPLRTIPTDRTLLNRKYHRELILRRGLYQYLVRAVGVLTAVLIILLVVESNELISAGVGSA